MRLAELSVLIGRFGRSHPIATRLALEGEAPTEPQVLREDLIFSSSIPYRHQARPPETGGREAGVALTL